MAAAFRGPRDTAGAVVTPGRPWRRRWHDEIVPLLWLAAVGVLLAVALGFSCIAGAAPASSPGEAFARDHAADICVALDAHPSVPGVVAVLSSLQSNGLSDVDAGVAVGTSVINVCPVHEGLLRQFVARYTKQAIR